MNEPVKIFGAFYEFELANNQAVPANVTNFKINKNRNYSFTAEYSIRRQQAGGPFVTGEEETAFATATGTGADDTIYTVAVEETSGDIVAGGQFDDFNGNGVAGLVKLDEFGVEDATFTGNLGTGFNNIVVASAIQSDGKVIVGGNFNTFNGNACLFLVRLNADGTEDTTFTTNLGTGPGAVVRDIFIQADGKILVGFNAGSFNGNGCSSLVRLNTNGTEDTAFTTALGTGFDDNVTEIFELASGDILVGGTFSLLNGSNVADGLVKLSSSGTLDSTFNTNLGSGFSNYVMELREQLDGKIVVGGEYSSFNGNTRNYLVRLNADGTEDTAFYTTLTSTGDNSGLNASVQGVIVQDNQSLIISGDFTTLNGVTVGRTVKLDSTGLVDTDFSTEFGTGLNGLVFSSAMTPAKQILLGGVFTDFNGNTRGRIAMLAAPVSPATDLIKKGTVHGIYKNDLATWTLHGATSVGDDVGVTLSITADGQIQYISSDLEDLVVNVIRFYVLGL